MLHVTSAKRLLERPNCRWKYNVGMHLIEVDFEDVDGFIQNQRMAFVNMVMIVRIP
jgi:hypothetical protein